MVMWVYATKENADAELSKRVAKLVIETIDTTGSAIVALSGGSTPIRMYRELANYLHSHLENSGSLHFIQVDERYVDPHHQRSNQKMIKSIFSDYHIVPMIVTDQSTNVSHGAYMTEVLYNQLWRDCGKMAPDLCILGMGTDGHTASLFPMDPLFIDQMSNDTKSVIGTEMRSLEEPRLSLTPQTINKSTKLLYIVGDDKLSALQLALESRDPELYPILSLITQLEIFAVSGDSSLVDHIRTMLEGVQR